MDANVGTACRGDDAVLERLGTILGITDPAPAGLQQAGRELHTWRTVDAELADLLRTAAARETTPAD